MEAPTRNAGSNAGAAPSLRAIANSAAANGGRLSRSTSHNYANISNKNSNSRSGSPTLSYRPQTASQMSAGDRRGSGAADKTSATRGGGEAAGLDSTLAELEGELEKKRLEVIQIKARINERLEAQHTVEGTLRERIRNALDEQQRKEDERREEATNEKAVRLKQINLEMEAMKEKVERLAEREQLGAAGLIRMSATLTDLELKAKQELTNEIKPLAVAAASLLEESKGNTSRLLPTLGADEVASFRALAEGRLRSQGADFSSTINNTSGHEGRKEGSTGGKAKPNAEVYKKAGSPLAYTTLQRESCPSSVALVETAESIKSNIAAFSKEVTLEAMLYSALFRRELERQDRLKEEMEAQTQALAAAQVVAKELADALIQSEERLTAINDRIEQMTNELNDGPDEAATLEGEIATLKQKMEKLDETIAEAEENKKKNNKEVDELRIQLNTLVKENGEVEAEKAKLAHQLESLEKQLDEVTMERTLSKTKRQAAEDKLFSSEQSKMKAARAIEDAEVALEAAKEKEKAKRQELADTESELKMAKASAAVSQKDLAAPLREKLANLQSEKERMTKEAAELKMKTLNTNIAIDAVKQKLESKRETNNDKEKEIEYLRKLLAQRGGGDGGELRSGSNASTMADSALGNVSRTHSSSSLAVRRGDHAQLGTNNSAKDVRAYLNTMDENQFERSSVSVSSFSVASSTPAALGVVSTNSEAAAQEPHQRGAAKAMRTVSTASSAAEAYLQTLGSSPELVRASRSPSAASDTPLPKRRGGEGYDHKQNKEARQTATTQNSVNAGPFSYPSDPTQAYDFPPQQSRDLTAEYYNAGIRRRPSPPTNGGTHPQQQQASALAMMRRDVMGGGGAEDYYSPHEQPQHQQRGAHGQHQQYHQSQRPFASSTFSGGGGGGGGYPAAVMGSVISSPTRPNNNNNNNNGGNTIHYNGNSSSTAAAAPAPSIATINSRLAAILERKNRRGQSAGGFY